MISRNDCLNGYDGLDPMLAGGPLPGGVGPDYAEAWLNYDYHLLSGSPAINEGSPVYAPATDIDGYPRDEEPDMGAYEYWEPLYIYMPLIAK